ncbi:MAG TPA: SAF domain-containing protein [Iamia sp.]|nr:SAF domain-containing protein [Iamia sp.]
MAATQTRTPRLENGSSPPAREGSDDRRIRPRRGLPGGRAVVGGLLVAVAAVGIFAAVSGAGRGPSTRYYVAARDIAAGTTLTRADLEAVAIEVPDRMLDRVFSDPDALIGAITVGPLSEGELVQAGGLATGADAEIPTFSVAVARADANAGELSRGDYVQVLATYGTDTAATTVTLSAEARIVSISEEDESLAAAGQVVVRLQVPSAEERIAIVNATTSGRVSLIRVSGAEDVEVAGPYQPDLDADTAAGDEATTTTTAPDEEPGG